MHAEKASSDNSTGKSAKYTPEKPPMPDYVHISGPSPLEQIALDNSESVRSSRMKVHKSTSHKAQRPSDKMSDVTWPFTDEPGTDIVRNISENSEIQNIGAELPEPPKRKSGGKRRSSKLVAKKRASAKAMNVSGQPARGRSIGGSSASGRSSRRSRHMLA